MKIAAIVSLSIVALICITLSAFLMFHNVLGWGYLIFIAFVAIYGLVRVYDIDILK